MSIDGFHKILLQQTNLFEELAKHQSKLQNLVFSKDYHLTEQNIYEMNKLSKKIQSGEHKRDLAFKNLLAEHQLAEHTDFTSFLETVDPVPRRALSQAFRSFKAAVFHARTLNEGIKAYTSSYMEVLGNIIDELYPGGSTYTAQGLRRTTAQAMVLDHSL